LSHEQPPAQQSQLAPSQLAPQQQPPSQQLAVLLAPACVPPKPLSANEANATENNFNMIELLVRHPHEASGPYCVNAQVMIECQKCAAKRAEKAGPADQRKQRSQKDSRRRPA
jgi:hypothetical protein